MSEDDVEPNSERIKLIETMVGQLIQAPGTDQFQSKSGLLVASAMPREHQALRLFFTDFRRYVVGWREDSGIEGFTGALLIPDLKVSSKASAQTERSSQHRDIKFFTVELDLHCSGLKGEFECRDTEFGRVWIPQLEERDKKTAVVLPN